ncbi:hypothetical protein SY83_02645 [Paenibacillus swuensis]|uniref:Alpha-L-rhamnosidase six-hairpin glycosidase domain-containing protein n=1 Tax=Paenibacillus swuensis TaxID=1178515 RepID=A0A172TEL8_9BACL|nr:hypothetical protein [Paenibacillus swuensis]ANE45402.1 hypothetical protein SY83_02645 [Paenibacillus swuensis]
MSRLKDLLDSHPNWIPPRSDQHTVIGLPHSRDHRKTFVEPGGSFSPGAGTFGVSLWIYDPMADKLHAPEEFSLDRLHWAWEDGYLPILNSTWKAAGIQVQQQLFAESVYDLQNIVNTLKIHVTNKGEAVSKVSMFVVLRCYGPAGGQIRSMAMNMKGRADINGYTVMLADQPPIDIGTSGFDRDGKEISEFLRGGTLPVEDRVEDSQGLCSGAFRYSLELKPGEEKEFEFNFFVHPMEYDYLSRFEQYHEQPYELKLGKVKQYWEANLKKVTVQLPDARYTNAYYSILAQMLIACVDHDARIATITYPLFWLRDCVYIVNALDKAGFHDEVRIQLERMKDRIFAGGFGAEGDAFGEGIWPYYTHYLLRGDRVWLEEVYPSLRERAEWIVKLRKTTEYHYYDVEMRLPNQRSSANMDLVCEPAKDGLIQGRMDGHIPVIWVNGFAHLGLKAISELAEALGLKDDGARYKEEAIQIQEALREYGRSAFGDNERDVTCAIWPTQAFSPDDVFVQEKFESWWQKNRLQGKAAYNPEPLWKYFELGQAHNYLLLGDAEKALQTVHYYLEHHYVNNLFGWLEDNHDVAEFWSTIEGWYKLPSRHPHGWVSSELFLLLRDLILYEKDRTLIVGEGVPPEWMELTSPIEVLKMPTSFGPVDVQIHCVDEGKVELFIHFHEKGRLPEEIDVRLPWKQVEMDTSIGLKHRESFIIGAQHYRDHGDVKITVQ